MLERKRTRGAGKIIRIALLIVFVGLMISVIIVFNRYQDVYAKNVDTGKGHIFLYIPTGSTYNEVWQQLDEFNILIDKKSFKWVTEKKGYSKNIKPGRYRIEDGMSNNELVNILRAGMEEPVMVIFNSMRSFEQLAGKIASFIEPDSVSILRHLLDPELPAKYGFTKETFMAMFIPNTYQMFWSSSSMDFTNRMAREYENFWKKRDKKLGKLEMTREEVSTLASIVDEETLMDEENPIVAGLYINRLKKGIPLQADPTLKFAIGDFSRKRIINADKSIDSPYNTYKYRGLPPGPIIIPSVSAIDGVLNYDNHNFIYMCAKSDFSGYHVFARTLKQHNRNAAEYQRELNRRGIYK